MADSFRNAQMASSVRDRRSKMCPYHRGKNVIFVCEDCNELACITCVTKEHSRHKFEELCNCIPKIKLELTDYCKNVEEKEIPLINITIESVETEIIEDKDSVQRKVYEIREHGNYIKKQIDDVTENLVQMFYAKGSKNTKILSNHKQNLNNRKDYLQSQLQEIGDAIETNAEAQMYDLRKTISSEFQDVVKPTKTPLDFTSKEINPQELVPLFGEYEVESSSEQSCHSSMLEPSNWRLSAKFTPCKNQFVTSLCYLSRDDRVLASFFSKSGHECRKIVIFLSQAENVGKKLELNVRVRDLCLSQRTGTLWFCCKKDNCIRELSGKKPKVRFQTTQEPESICLTADDQIVIGHIGQVIKYSQTGEPIEQTDAMYPYHISECPKTRRLAVVDLDFSKYKSGTDGTPSVLILDRNLFPLCTFKGKSGQQSTDQSFYPQDVCYTSTGDLVVADKGNKEVILVNEKGEYKQTIYTFTEPFPTAVCSVDDNCLWISYEDGSIHILHNDYTF